MNTIPPIQGFKEIEHTSDIALEVWAASLENLFIEASKGLQNLMGIKTQGRSTTLYKKEINGMDMESVLVSFLDDLLFLVEQKNCWCNIEQVSLINLSITYSGKIIRIRSLEKQLKAVTFNDLQIVSKDNYWKTRIVFDV
jgi:SHS2 domain-containing protein